MGHRRFSRKLIYRSKTTVVTTNNTLFFFSGLTKPEGKEVSFYFTNLS